MIVKQSGVESDRWLKYFLVIVLQHTIYLCIVKISFYNQNKSYSLLEFLHKMCVFRAIG